MPPGAPNERVVALGPIRHACHACGSCCTGWRVRVVDDERERIERHAAELGVAEPIVDGNLRHVAGSCVFLGEDRLCTIHSRFGATEKPMVCQLFPRVAVLAEDGLRIGADPGCSSTWRSWIDGPELDMPVAAGFHREHLPPELAATERELIRLCRVPGMTLAQLVGIVAGQPGHAPKFPPGFLRRLLKPLKGLDFLLTHEDAGPLWVGDIHKATNFIRNVDAERPPRLNVTREMSALALEMLQRTLFLRLGDKELPPMGKLVLFLGGAIACAYVYPRIDSYGPALAAWMRFSRLPRFWEPFIPDTAAARFIMTGA